MEYKIIWSPYAVANLKEIYFHIAKDSPRNASQFTEELIEIAENIQFFPMSGRVVPEFEIDNLRERIYKNYRVVYRITENSVEIAAIQHGARLLKKI